MVILCDTSAILMLLAIVPDMFKNPRYECVTIRQVYEEIVRTTKFKMKYPWMHDLRGGIRFLPTTESESQRVRLFYDAITALNDNATVNSRTQKIFDLSRVDRWVIACAAAFGFALCTGDGDLRDFAIQQFDTSGIFPLEIVNSWLEKGHIKWDTQKAMFLRAWADQNEHRQPEKARKRFVELTGAKYEGS